MQNYLQQISFLQTYFALLVNHMLEEVIWYPFRESEDDVLTIQSA